MKKFTLALILLGGCAAPDLPPSVPEMCEETVRDYAILRDGKTTSKAYGDLFTEDGEFHLAGDMTKGKDALIARHLAANAETIWRHNMTEIKISQKDGEIRGQTRFHIFAGPRADAPIAPNREILGTYRDEFMLVKGVCKIKSRKVEIVFDKKT